MAYTKSNPNGQAASANSSPVVLASDQSLPVGASTSANQTTHTTRLTEIRDYLDTVETSLNSLNAKDYATQAKQYLMRPSEKTGRTHKHASAGELSATTTLYTVTAGKTFYLTSLVIQLRNTSVTAGGQAAISDGATRKMYAQVAVAVAGQVVPSTALSNAFPEPVPFTTNVTFEVIAGTLVAAVTVTGYEE